jgi:hypothetical protein
MVDWISFIRWWSLSSIKEDVPDIRDDKLTSKPPIFRADIFQFCRPFIHRAVVQGRVVSLRQRWLTEDLHGVSAISSGKCIKHGHSLLFLLTTTLSMFNYYFDYIDSLTMSAPSISLKINDPRYVIIIPIS